MTRTDQSWQEMTRATRRYPKSTQNLPKLRRDVQSYPEIQKELQGATRDAKKCTKRWTELTRSCPETTKDMKRCQELTRATQKCTKTDQRCQELPKLSRADQTVNLPVSGFLNLFFDYFTWSQLTLLASDITLHVKAKTAIGLLYRSRDDFTCSQITIPISKLL